MPHNCDGGSVGVTLRRVDDNTTVRTGLIQRPDAEGAAPVAGHIYDAHSDPDSAARAELREEIGLTVTGPLRKVLGGDKGVWLPNRCKSPNPHHTGGHTWYVYAVDYADTTGTLTLAPDEVDGFRWYTDSEVRDLAAVTAHWATGKVTSTQWKADPGLEPPWCLLGHEMRWFVLTPKELTAIRDVCSTPPATRLP